ncbi:MAG: FlgD immunoglobulin-like domain containing protein [candidate division KSB1 bacterium]
MFTNFWNKTLASYWRMLRPNFLAAITLIWSSNGERDLAGYKVYIGDKPKQYSTVITVGKRTRYDLAHLPRNKTHYLAVTAYDVSGNESPHSLEVILPATTGGGETPAGEEKTLERAYNFPNPFRAGSEATTIRYFLAEAARVTIQVYDVKGDLIKTLLDKAQRSAGENLGDRWDGTDLNGISVSPGLYFVEIQAQDRKAIVKLVVRS